ncbi:Neuroligin-4, Y-linked [Amphibalanus amphitrite]|uniref:Neuroligin-4, Y-linked n=1 Tax=Amphibalanus amphitrite TaxID=1232801 RepID=A0A6A4W105_AMPAM|nr:Neuroligin-4, Y-linked [Amphibalanus amphitrite]
MERPPLLAMVPLLLALLTASGTAERGRAPQGKPSRVIRTRRGSVQGVEVHNGPRLPPVEAYLGLPYAAPPTRFMPPTSPPSWSGVRDGRYFRPVCPQQLPDLSNRTAALLTMPAERYERLLRLRQFLTDESEDCLFLNIYTPATGETARARYPVMVYVHGESFSYGSGNALDGSVLASFGAVVVVTLNYRLGVLGFLNSNLEPVRAVANYGLLDIVAALEFVRLTVAAFGGDPTNVTVFGHGAGAACINFLMTNPLNATVQLAAGVNCTATQSALLPCLRTQPLSALLAAPVVAPRFLPPFGPSLDGIVINDELFTRRASYAHRLVSYRVLAGVTAADADQQLSESQLSDGVTAAQRDSTLRTYVQNTYSYHLNELVSVVRHDYTDWSRGQQPPRRLRDQLVHALSDAQYVAPVTRTVDMYPDDQNTYFYVFNGGSDYSDGKKVSWLSAQTFLYTCALSVSS